jgi:hypothetical protein
MIDPDIKSAINSAVDSALSSWAERKGDRPVNYYVQPYTGPEIPEEGVPVEISATTVEPSPVREKIKDEPITIPRHELEELLQEALDREWGVVDDPDDRGGPTAHGITQIVAEEYGYEVNDITPQIAKDIFEHKYYFSPKINFIPDRRLQWRLLIDGLHSGPVRIIKRLQEILNFQNNFERHYANIKIDGYLGPQTFRTLRIAKASFRDQYAYKGITEPQLAELFWKHMCLQMHALQFSWYHDIVKRIPEQEKFYNGWKNRIAFPPEFYQFSTGLEKYK